AFAAGVAGVDQRVDILALDQPGQHLQPALGFFDRPQPKVRRGDRQGVEGPSAFLYLKLLRHTELEQMAPRRREDITFALEVVVMLGKAAQRLGDVAGDRRLFCDYQCFTHRKSRTFTMRPRLVATPCLSSALKVA